MKLEHVPGPDNEKNITDTDKLSDVPAELLEAAEIFRNLCVKYKRQFFLTLNANDDPTGRSYAFWSYMSEKLSPKEIIEPFSAKRALSREETSAFYDAIHMGVINVSNGLFFLVRNPLYGYTPTQEPPIPPKE